MENGMRSLEAIARAVADEIGEDNSQAEIEAGLYEIWKSHCSTGESFEEYKAKHMNITPYERLMRSIESANNTPGHLNEQDGYDCPLCLNRGYINVPYEYLGVWRDGVEMCKCQTIRKSIRRLKASGLQRGIARLKDFKVEQPFQQQMLDVAKAYLAADHSRGQSLYMGGTPGCGKTMLGTAICRELILRGNDVVYMPWVAEAQKIKSLAMDEGQAEYLDTFKDTGYLYIDDLFKPLPGQAGPTPADVRLAYDIINYRYINKMPMIISSEKHLSELAEIDEATISRVYEMAGDYVVNVDRKPGRNWRLKKMGETI